MSAIERYTAEGGERRMGVLQRQATILASSKLVPASLRGKPEDVLAIALTLDQLGVPVGLNTINECGVVNGKVLLSGQLLCALVANQGHDLWFEERTGGQAVACVRRAGSERTHRLTYTREMARESGAFDVWVERQVEDGTWGDSGKKKFRTEKFTVGTDAGMTRPDNSWPEWVTKALAAGQTRRNDAWHHYPESMLGWRAVRRVLKVAAPDALMGLPASPFIEPPARPDDDQVDDVDPTEVDIEDNDHDDQVVDAELVQDDDPADSPREEDGDGEASAPPAPDVELADEWDLISIRNMVASHDAEIREAIADGWQWGSVKDGTANPLAKTDVPGALDLVTSVSKAVYDRRRRHAMAVMGNVDVKDTKARHALVKEATGEIESTATLTAAQLAAIIDYCKGLEELDQGKAS